MVANGSFREDLYYRIKVVEMKIPPLRDRREDIPLLVDFFLKRFSVELDKKIDGVSSDVMDLFMNCRWPGNVRELEHVVEHGSILCRHTTITLSDLPEDFVEDSPSLSRPQRSSEASTTDAQTLLKVLEEKKWNKAEVARALGISRQTLYRRLRESGIKD
jgi:transcriptional regulator with PAS, ATPase and Fis domain